MDSTGFSINTIQGTFGPPDATEAKISKALAELSTCFQEGADFKSYLRQLRKYALLKTGIVISDLASCSCCLLDSCDYLTLLPSAWLPSHLRAFSTAPFSSCMRTLTDITAVADVFCAGNISAAQILLSSDPSRWPYAECYDVLALEISPGPPRDRTVLPHGTPFGQAAGPLQSGSELPYGAPSALFEGPQSPAPHGRRADAAAVSLASPPAAPVPPSPGVFSREEALSILSSTFGENSSYDSNLRAVFALLDARFERESPPMEAAVVVEHLDRQPGFIL